MHIRHEGPHSDTHWHVHAPLLLELSDRSFVKIDNWSLNGFDWSYDAVECPTEATLHIPFQGVNISFPVKLKCSNSDNYASFEDLNGRHREALALFHRSLLSGQMTSTPDVIRALDTPLDLVPMGETEDEKAKGLAKAPARRLRIVLNLAIYTTLALIVIWIVGGALATKIGTIDIHHGRVLPSNPTLCDVPYSSGNIRASPSSCAPLTSAQDISTTGPLAVGWVSERLVEKVYIGMPVRSTWNTQGRRTVVRGDILAITAHATPQSAGDFAINIVVQLRAQMPDTLQALPAGYPLQLTAIRPLYGKAATWTSDRGDAYE